MLFNPTQYRHLKSLSDFPNSKLDFDSIIFEKCDWEYWHFKCPRYIYRTRSWLPHHTGKYTRNYKVVYCFTIKTFESKGTLRSPQIYRLFRGKSMSEIHTLGVSQYNITTDIFSQDFTKSPSRGCGVQSLWNLASGSTSTAVEPSAKFHSDMNISTVILTGRLLIWYWNGSLLFLYKHNLKVVYI